jgi:hypothetical protein
MEALRMIRPTCLGIIAISLAACALAGCDEELTAPARVCVNPGKNHPPSVTIENAYAEGFLRGDPVVISIEGPGDTVPMGSALTFEWTGEDPDTCDEVVSYRFHLTGDEGYTPVGKDVTSVTYSDFPPGRVTFALTAVDGEGAVSDPGSRLSFFANYPPDIRFGPEFIEKREVGGTVVDIPHSEGDTVAVGSRIEITVHATDPDGDDEELRHSGTFVTHKTCGGSTPTFSFFDEDDKGPTQTCVVELSHDPRQSGLHRCRSRTRDEYGLVCSSPVEFRFHSNLPPVFGQADVLVNGIPLDQTDLFQTNGTITVRVISATDPDPGHAPVALEALCELEELNGPYRESTERRALGEDMSLGPVPGEGAYKLTVSVSDYGCRETSIEKDIAITIDWRDPCGGE